MLPYVWSLVSTGCFGTEEPVHIGVLINVITTIIIIIIIIITIIIIIIIIIITRSSSYFDSISGCSSRGCGVSSEHGSL